VNLANVRSVIGITIAVVLLLVLAPTAAAKEAPRADLLWLPSGTTVGQLSDAGLSPGVMSAGLGAVPAEQTYLDITQGNRVFDSLYDTDLPPQNGTCPKWWRAVEERAASAPADIVPGLLSMTLAAAGVDVRVGGETSCTFSAHPSSDGRDRPTKKLSEAPHPNVRSATFEVRNTSLKNLASLARNLQGPGFLIAIARPTGRSDDPLPIGIAGPGFDGNLTSDSTRLDGYVLSTDVAPTILEHFGIEIPTEMSGQALFSEGAVDPAAIDSLTRRMGVISHRRGPVIGLSLLLWLVLLGASVAVTRGRAARMGVRLAGLSVVYMPLVLLVAAAIEPGETVEALLVAIGSPALAAVTLALLPGYRAIAAAAAVTVVAYAIDVLAGSPLTSLSLLGPNPGLGVRFYGIGNELEALLAVLVVAGTGAGLAGFAPHLSRRDCAVSFLAVGLAFAFVFAAGRFGADVGAAIVLPVGAAVAAASIAGGHRRAVLLAIAAPLAFLALLALVDLLSGANAHLTRSVLDAGGLGELAEVAERRLQLSVNSFGRPVLLAFLPVVAIALTFAIARRDRLRAWLAGWPAVRAGLLGALVATAIGTLANDSGALLLEIGTAYLLVFVGFVWAENRDKKVATTKSYNPAHHVLHLFL
jgi:hypothetical protein